MKTKNTLSLFLIPILICLVVVVYYRNLVMTENIRFPKDSIEYRLLTPNVIKNIQIDDIGEVKYYYYSAADGNKPLINAIKLESNKDKNYIESKITQHLINNQFTKIKSGKFIKDNQKISVLFEKNNSNTWNASIIVIEVIK